MLPDVCEELGLRSEVCDSLPMILSEGSEVVQHQAVTNYCGSESEVLYNFGLFCFC